MKDSELLQRLSDRDDTVIAALEDAYGGFCSAVAYRILGSREDAEEIVNDALHAAWNAIPPAQPMSLRAYLGKMTRNLALKRLRFDTALKRGGGEVSLALEELEECLPGPDSPEREAEQRELAERIDRFLRTLPETERQIFVERYWYMARIEEIAGAHGFSKAKTTSQLHRTRKKLGRLLEKEELL